MRTTNALVFLLAVLSATAVAGGPAAAQSKLPAYKRTIHWKARIGDLAAVKAMLEKNPKLLHARDGDKRTPLHLAARWGRVEIVDLLLRKGAKLNARAYNNFTPLYLACAFGRDKVVKRLIAARPETDTKTSFGRRPLQVAAERGYKKIVRLLFYAGAVYDASTAIHLDDRKRLSELLEREQEKTATHANLVVAVRTGRGAAVDMLLHAGAPLTAQHTLALMGPPLSVAWYALKYPAILEKLVDAGIDPHAKLRGRFLEGQTLLDAAARGGHSASALYLMRIGLKPTVRTLHQLIRKGMVDVVERVLAAGVEPTSQSTRRVVDDMQIASLQPAYNKRTKRQAVLREIAKRLFEAGAPRTVASVVAFGTEKELKAALEKKPRARDVHRAGWIALKMRRPHHLALLLDGGLAVDATDSSKRSLLWWAAWLGHVPTVELLVRRGASLGQPDKHGGTPLHAAARTGKLDACVLLIRRGADRKATDKKGKTPHALAKEAGYGKALLDLLAPF